MAGPPTRSSLSLAFRNNWRRRRGFALAVWIASVLRIARSDAEESQRRAPVTAIRLTAMATAGALSAELSTAPLGVAVGKEPD
jgi:hypothetical protein